MTPPAQILHIDDHGLFRDGIAEMIRSRWPDAVIEGCGTYLEGQNHAWERDWSIIILDIHLGGRTGVDLLRDIRSQKKSVPVLVLTMLPETHLASRVFRLGATGFVRKDASRQTLLEAVQNLLEGRRFITMEVAQQLAGQLAGDIQKMPHETLSDREFAVMQNLASGKTVKEIASMMGLSVKTVSTYRSRLLEKMDLNGNSGLMKYCLDNDLLAFGE